jgi:hypothetical protein
MNATVWRGGNGSTYGIRVGNANRDKYSDRRWTRIEVEIGGRFHIFSLTPGFWNKCPEFRDSGAPIIRGWLHQHGLLKWPKGNPPQLELLPLGGARFRLVE